MNAFGIRFRVSDQNRFESLRQLFYKLKADKENDSFDPQEWPALVPEEVKPNFDWPTDEDRQKWLSVRNSTVICYGDPADDLSTRWDFFRVFESIEEGEYSLISCELIEERVAEIHIDPEAYPYGGVDPMIALAEAFGFFLLGVNEYGKYQTREQLLGKG